MFMRVTRDMVEDEIIRLGLESFLNAHGVNSTTIKKSQLLESRCSDEMRKYYDRVKLVELNSNIETKFIEGINREVSNLSWFKIVEYAIYGVPHGTFLNMSTVRFLDQLAVLSELGLSGYNDYFQSHYSFDFNCYIDSDNNRHYYLSGDGNHRTTVAKLLDLKYVHVNKLVIYEYNPEKFHKLESYKLGVEQLNNLLTSPLFQFTKLGLSLDGVVEVNFDTMGKYFSRMVRIKTKEGRSAIVLNPKGLDSDEMVVQRQRIDIVVETMKNIQKKHNHFLKIYKYYPMWLKKTLFEIYIFLNESMAFDGEYGTYHRRLAKLSALSAYINN